MDREKEDVREMRGPLKKNHFEMTRFISAIVAIIFMAGMSFAQQPVFYDDINYEGRGWNLDCGWQYSRLEDFNSSFWGGFYGGCYSGPCNWRVSSIKVPPGCKVILYDQFNFGGNSIEFTADQPNLVSCGWNDRASSIRIYGAAQQQLQPQPQEQKCGGSVTFRNWSGTTLYLYAAVVSKYSPSNFYMCDYYRGVLTSSGLTISVPEGYSLSFCAYSGSCMTNTIRASGIYQDCHAVGQYHDIH